MQNVYATITATIRSGRKMLVRLIDPDKADVSTICDGFDFYFVGGSTAADCTSVVRAIHAACTTPVVLFPGHPSQFTPEADALLFLTLMNSRDPRYLLDWQMQSAGVVAESGIESIPMGYVLIDGGRQSATQRMTGARVVARDDVPTAVRMAQTAELTGKRLVYLEAGSGAATPVPEPMISAVKQAIHVPLIVGGGICSPEQMYKAFAAGADIVVVGNHFERHPEDIKNFIEPLSKLP